MANGQTLQVLCLGILASFNGVMTGERNADMTLYHAKLSFAEKTEEIIGIQMGLNNTSIILLKDETKQLSILQYVQDLNMMLRKLKTMIVGKAIRIEIWSGADFKICGTLMDVEFDNYKKNLRVTGGFTANFKFTFTLDSEYTKWQPCLFENRYQGYRLIGGWEIFLDTTEDVINYLINRLKDNDQAIEVQDVNADWSQVENGSCYTIKGFGKSNGVKGQELVTQYTVTYKEIQNKATTTA